jgi:flagellar motor switch protein FliG
MNLKDQLNKAYGGKSPERRRDEVDGPATPAIPAAKGKPSAQAKGAPPQPHEGLEKKTSADRGYRKVAKFLLLLGQEEAARVMQHLQRDELEGIVREISTIKRIEPVEAEAILSEFGALIKSGGALQGGGSDAARDILVQAFGEKKGDEYMRRALPGENKPFPYLKALDANQILILLKDESSHVMAIVLPQLDPKIASEVLLRLPEAARMEAVKRMAKLEKISPEVLESIDSGLRKKTDKLGKHDTESVDGAQALAGILRFFDPQREEEILDALEETDPELSDSIRERLFTLEDVLRVRHLDLQRELREFEDKEIALILKGKSDAFRDALLACVSKDRRLMIMDDFEVLGSVRRQDVDAKTREFIVRLKHRYESGDLVLEGDDDLIG